MELFRTLLRRLVHVIYRPYVLWRISQPSRATVSGQGLVTDPLVFHPIYFFSTKIVIRHLASMDLEGRRFLDMGTGTGSIGIFAATRGAIVTCCDINPRAVEIARENAAGNRVAVEVLESDVFLALSGRHFDVICFNVPFYPRAPRTPFEAAFFAGPNFETVRSFASGCAAALSPAPDAAIVVIFSEDSGRALMVSIFAGAGFVVAREIVETRLFERFHLITFSRGP
jgi:release factor glutamine methyltransferase